MRRSRGGGHGTVPMRCPQHRARLLPVLWHQLRSPLLGLLLAAAIASYFVGERSDAVIIGVIVGLSVGLGFVNEYRAEKAAEALHSQIRHQTVVIRGGRPITVDVTTLVPGDVVELRLGDIVPADIRLFAVTGLECDESVLTGESLPVNKNTIPVPPGTALAELSGCALMGTVVHAGSAGGIVVATGARTEFGKIAAVPHPSFFADHVDLRDQRGAAQADHRRVAVLAGDRGWDHPAVAARGRVHQPRRRLAADEPAQGAGQTAGVY